MTVTTAAPAARTGPSALDVDLYEVTMALAYLREGLTGPATFSLFARDLPPDRGFLVAAGVDDAVAALLGLEVGDAEVAAFAAALGRPAAELAPLRGLRFTGDVDAVPDGAVVLPGEPLIEVTAPLPEAQVLETLLLNRITHQTALAAKAARSVLAAAGRRVVDFGLRRAHGIEAGMHAARAGAIVGFAATSNVAAALAYGLPATGTMAHSFVQVFPAEADAFAAFARHACGPVVLLVDTYDTERGVLRAAEVLRALPEQRRIGVRLDSGDLAALAVRARRLLDDAGLGRAEIVVSGGLDEYAVGDLVAAGAPVDVFAVGTAVATSADAPSLDTAYKLVAYDGRPVMKLSAGKVTLPAPKQVFRGAGCADVIGLRAEAPPPGTRPLLEPAVRAGRRSTPSRGPAEAVAVARERFRADLADLPATALAVRSPVPPRPAVSPALRTVVDEVRRRVGG